MRRGAGRRVYVDDWRMVVTGCQLLLVGLHSSICWQQPPPTHGSDGNVPPIHSKSQILWIPESADNFEFERGVKKHKSPKSVINKFLVSDLLTLLDIWLIYALLLSRFTHFFSFSFFCRFVETEKQHPPTFTDQLLECMVTPDKDVLEALTVTCCGSCVQLLWVWVELCCGVGLSEQASKPRRCASMKLSSSIPVTRVDIKRC